MVRVTNRDNTRWRMLYNEHVLLMDLGNQVEFKIVDSDFRLSIVIEFFFSSGGEKLKSDVKIAENGDKISVTLFQWDSYSWGYIEVTEPLRLNLKDGRKLWLKYRTQSVEKSGFRNFHLTVFGEESVSW